MLAFSPLGVLTTGCTDDELLQKLLARGLVYTRWGKTTCPSTPGTQLVYAGKTGGSRWHDLGGASNYICLPENPDYSDYQPGVQGLNHVYGTEYQTAGSPLSSVYNYNAPCTVCYTSARGTTLMIPAKTQCPPSWTVEYYGYLMAEDRHNNHGRTTYVCVDTLQKQKGYFNPARVISVAALCAYILNEYSKHQ